MTTRWWHHDDRDGVPTRTAYDNSTSSNYRQQPAPQQYPMQTPMRAEATEFKPNSQVAPQAAPGFNRTGPAVAKAQLPKCWEYEDPLKDVHGPYDAATIINWFAQDWFGNDLKIRRVGQYWTMLEYVVQELKAEARGQTAPPSTGYTSAPQQLPQAATTPATSYGTQHMPAAAAGYGRPAAAAPAAAEQWGGAGGNYLAAAPAAADQWGGGGGSYPAAAPDDGWGASAGNGRPERVDRGYLSGAAAAVGPAAAQTRPRGRGATAADEFGGGSSGFGSEDYSGVRGRGARDKEREAAAGVQFGSDGKWERGYVIDRENRRGGRANKGYQDYDSYGDEYGGGSSSRESRRGTSRGGRGDRGSGYGGDRDAGGYDRASRILEGADDDEYGGSSRAPGRAAREPRGPGMAAAPAGGSGREYKQESAPAWDSAGSPAKPRSKREGRAGSNWQQGNSAAAAVAAATAGLGSLGLSTADASEEAGGSSAAPAAVNAATEENADGWGSAPAAEITHSAAAADDGWGNSAAPVSGKWGDEPVESDSPTADDASAQAAAVDNAVADSAAAPPADKPQEPAAVGDGDNWGSAAASSVNSPKRATDSSGADDAAVEKPVDDAEELEPNAAAAAPATESNENSSTPAAAEASVAATTADEDEQKPKLSKVQQLILLQEQLTQQGAADKARTSPPRTATPPRTPLKTSASTGSLADAAGPFGSPKVGEPAAAADDGHHADKPHVRPAEVADAESAAGGEGGEAVDAVLAPEPAAAEAPAVEAAAEVPAAEAAAEVPAAEAAAAVPAAADDDGPQPVGSITPAAAGTKDEPTAAAAAPAPAMSDKEEPKPAAVSGSEGGLGGISVAGITAGIFSRVAGALMGGGSAVGGGSAAAGEKAAEAESDKGSLEATAGPTADD